MTREITGDGIDQEDVNSTHKVLETLRQNFNDDDRTFLANVIEEADYLVQKYEEEEEWYPETKIPDTGDIVIDPESNPKYGDGRVEVYEVLENVPANEYKIDSNRDKTVADMNPYHPERAPVVVGTYVDGSDKVYAFPVTRLKQE